MTLRDFCSPRSIPFDDRRDQVAVFLACHRPLIKPENVDPCEKTELVIDLKQCLADPAIAAFPGDDLVEGQGQFDLLMEFVGGQCRHGFEPSELPHQVMEFGDRIGGDAFGGQPASTCLEDLTEFVELSDIFAIEFQGEIAASRSADGETIMFNAAQGFAQRCSTNLNAACKISFAQTLAGPDGTGEDYFSYRVVSELAKRFEIFVRRVRAGWHTKWYTSVAAVTSKNKLAVWSSIREHGSLRRVPE